MRERDLAILKKVLKEIDCLNNLTNDTESFASFDADDKTKRASVMTLINIGELVRHLSKEFKGTHRDIPFHAITGLRNVAAHGYLTLSFKLIWSTIKDAVPELKSKIEKLLKA